MDTARVFRSGNSQAIRQPKEFRFAGKEVEIFRIAPNPRMLLKCEGSGNHIRNFLGVEPLQNIAIERHLLWREIGRVRTANRKRLWIFSLHQQLDGNL